MRRRLATAPCLASPHRVTSGNEGFARSFERGLASAASARCPSTRRRPSNRHRLGPPVNPCSGAQRRCRRSSASAAAAPSRRRRGSGGELHLERVHRIDVRVAQLDRPLAARAGAASSRSSPIAASTASTARACSASISPNGAGSSTSDEIAAGDREARLGERHLEVVDQRPEERQPPVELGAGRRASTAANALPAPNQAGSSDAVLRPREHPRDRAQRCEVVLAAGPARRPRGDLEQRELVHRRERAEERREGVALPDEGAVGAPRARRPARRAARDPHRSAAAAAAPGYVASSVPASAASRLRWASPSRLYLNDIVSPCSVTFSRPGGKPAGCEAIAACVGPPPRPALPPRPWKIVSSTPRSRGDGGELLLRAVDRPLRGDVAAVLAGVGVADHHLDRLGPLGEQLSTIPGAAPGRRPSRTAADREVGERAGAPDVVGRRGARDDEAQQYG